MFLSALGFLSLMLRNLHPAFERSSRLDVLSIDWKEQYRDKLTLYSSSFDIVILGAGGTTTCLAVEGGLGSRCGGGLADGDLACL